MFNNALDSHEVGEANGKVVHCLNSYLDYEDERYRARIPSGFYSDQASVPRIPVVFLLWGDRAHREAVFHDFGYCRDAQVYDKLLQIWFTPTRAQADMLFRRAMRRQGQGPGIYIPMWLGVRIGGWPHYHKRKVDESIRLDVAY